MTETLMRHARIAGLDVARALALFGMFAAHVGNVGAYGPGGWRWLLATHGRPSAVFALLAGVSIALMLANATSRLAAGGDPLRHTRIRVAVRGALLIGLGWLLGALGTPVDVILDNLGVMFFLALIALAWRPWTLIAVGAAILACGRPVLGAFVDVIPAWLADLPVIHELWSLHYPALLWIGYVLVGMGIGKLRPWRGAALAWLAASGIVLALVAYGAAWLILSSKGEPVLWETQWGVTTRWFEISAHSYTGFEMLGNVGVALAVIALCCWLADALPRLMWPLAATGSMTLTLYSAHIVMIVIVGTGIVFAPSNVALIALCAGCLIFASLWKWRLGQGPLERFFTTVSTAAAEIDARRARVSPPA